MVTEIPTDEEVTLYRCPVCGQETIWFECGEWDRGDGIYAESGYGPLLEQACDCKLTQSQVNAFPVMDMCQPNYDEW